MSNAFTAPHFQTPQLARAWLEARRWPDGPICSHCGVANLAYTTKRDGVYRCANKECRKDFSVTTGTLMERSHIELNKWLIAFYLMASSKKGISAHQLHRALGLDYKSAWFLGHRIREAMFGVGFDDGQLGGEGEIVEADETYHGKTDKPRASKQRGERPYKSGSRGPRDKRPVLALVERGGKARTFHIAVADKATVSKIVTDNVAKESRLHTDESRLYTGSEDHFAAHETVKHSAKEYARDDVHCNTAEGLFSVFKRGMTGIYQHCSEKHLHRYLAEYEFRFNHRTRLGVGDIDRTIAAIDGIAGKRLLYRQPNQA
jgi:transposase-like protein